MTVPTPGSPVRQEGRGENPPRPPARGHAPHDRGQSLKSAEQVTVILLNLPGRARKSRAGLGLGPFPGELTPSSLTAPRGRRVLCPVASRAPVPSPRGSQGCVPTRCPRRFCGPCGYRCPPRTLHLRWCPRLVPRPRWVGGSTLVKVQRSHALGAQPCPALPSLGVRQALSALKCWRASPPRSVHPSSSSRTDARL